ncbi:MAG: molybdopterin cofactor-binding domain-containing protein [Pseudomonadota bacterium]
MDARTPTPPTAQSPAAPSAKSGLTRRKLLIGATAATGLVIGYAVWPRDRRLNLAVRPDEMLINGFLKIGNDGRVTVACPQAEMGQGVYTALPQLLAGELGADWRRVAVEPAPLHPLYANRAFVAEAGASMPALFGNIVNWAAITVVERLELQATGGSTSIKAFWEPLRLAGASARALLIAAAARKLDVDPGTLDTVDGYVVGKRGRIAFGELAPLVDPEDAPETPRLRADAPLIGRPVPRLDIPAKTNGSAQFGADVRLDGMVYATVRGAPFGAGPRAVFGAEAARETAGVLAVVDGVDNEDGFGGWYATVAETWWTARQALDLIDVEYEEGELADSEAIDAALLAALDDEDAGTAYIEVGDADAVLDDETIEADYAVPFLAHACLEPMTATVRLTGDRAEIWVPTQSQSLIAWKVADALDIAADDVRIYPTFIGGGFGRKAEVDAAVQAAQIAKEVGRPVQLIWHREEDQARDMFRPPARARMRARIGPDKRIAAMSVKLAAPNLGASVTRRLMPFFASDGDSASMLRGMGALPYRVPAYHARHVDVPTPVTLGYWRSVEHSYAAFFEEGFMDELAAMAGVDPLTFRLRHMDRAGRPAKALILAASKGALSGVVSEGRGRGIALHSSFGSHVAQVAEVEMLSDEEIIVKRVTCVVDCGRVVNPDIVKAQMEGGIIFGLTAALHGRIRFVDGEPEAQNFDGYPLLRMDEAPDIDVHIVESTDAPGGVGEPGVPPIAPAVASAVFAATGRRVRTLPMLDY